MSSILVLHGPNLNLLGMREPEVYGKMSLADIDQILKDQGQAAGVNVHTSQSNSEGVMIDMLHAARQWASGVIINPGGYSYTSVSIADAVRSLDLPVIEVHMSNIYAREQYRSQSLIAPACVGLIAGFGHRSYILALQAMIDIVLNGQPSHHPPLTA